MALEYGFYNSINGDRKYDAVQMNSIFDGVISDGVFAQYGGGFEVVRTSGANLVFVNSGRAWFNHTWTHNTSSMRFSMPGPHNTYPRWDAVVIEVDTNNRTNSIKAVSGVPSSSPNKPEMTNTDGVYQYPLAYIYRERSSTNIMNIEDNRGTESCPWVESPLSLGVMGDVANHNAIFRGKNLGPNVTSAQKTSIRNGSFTDLYIGDYWEVGGNKWRISLIMDEYLYVYPDNPIRKDYQPNGSSDILARMFNEVYSSIPSTIKNAALAKEIQIDEHNLHFSGVTWFKGHSLSGLVPTTANLFGQRFTPFELDNQKTLVVYSYEQMVQHPLFQLAPQYAKSSEEMWLGTWASRDRLYVTIPEKNNSLARLNNSFLDTKKSAKIFVRIG